MDFFAPSHTHSHTFTSGWLEGLNKKLPMSIKSCLKVMIKFSLEKWKTLTPFQKLSNSLGQHNVATGFKKLPNLVALIHMLDGAYLLTLHPNLHIRPYTRSLLSLSLSLFLSITGNNIWSVMFKWWSEEPKVVWATHKKYWLKNKHEKLPCTTTFTVNCTLLLLMCKYVVSNSIKVFVNLRFQQWPIQIDRCNCDQ